MHKARQSKLAGQVQSDVVRRCGDERWVRSSWREVRTDTLDAASRLPDPLHDRDGARQVDLRGADVDAYCRAGAGTCCLADGHRGRQSRCARSRRRAYRSRRWRRSAHTREAPHAIGRHATDAAVEQVAVGAELGGEAVAGVHGRHIVVSREGDGRPQCGVFPNEGHGTRPRRHCLDALGERHPDHAADRVAGTPGPACRLKFGDESRYLRRVEHF
jgi:hypothetical protein